MSAYHNGFTPRKLIHANSPQLASRGAHLEHYPCNLLKQHVESSKNAKANEACLRCGTIGEFTRGPGAGPHHARLICAACGRFVKWLPAPPTQKQIVFLRWLGHTGPIPQNKKEASALIDQILEGEGI
jgi:hypothetical protein